MRMSRKAIRILSAVVISLLAAAFFFHDRELTGAQQANAPHVRVVAVHDGDTVSIIIAGRKKEKVRLIGIDAPELGQRPWGVRAKKHLTELVELSGWDVIPEFDIERRDKYGRLLGYLWTADGKLINLEMVKDGYAVLFTLPPNVRYVNRLREGQHYARGKGLGIWGPGGLKERPGDYRRRHQR